MTGPEITGALVRRLLAEQFPQWADLPVTHVELDGWDNRTFRLGDRMSVRLPSGEGYAAQVDKEQRWLPVLAPQLPLPVPHPLAHGRPGPEFPWPWSVYRWLDGEPATIDRVTDLDRFASDLAGFLAALYGVDTTDGPGCGAHSHSRGCPLTQCDAQTRGLIDALSDRIDRDAATAVWNTALRAEFDAVPVWFHGDVAATNLLLTEGRLSAVIDFGCSGVGDPACDVPIAWTLFSGSSRHRFRDALRIDDATWARGRGWALWKALFEIRHAATFDAGASRPGWQRMGWRHDATAIVEDLLGDS